MLGQKMCAVCTAGFTLAIIGALNWGLVGLGAFIGRDLNVVHMLLGQWPQVESIVYILVGLGGLVAIFHSKCTMCKKM